MSELDIGLKVPAWFVAVLKCKIGSPAAWRDIVLRAGRIPAETAVQKGIIESAHVSAEETVRAAVKLGEELVGKGLSQQPPQSKEVTRSLSSPKTLNPFNSLLSSAFRENGIHLCCHVFGWFPGCTQWIGDR